MFPMEIDTREYSQVKAILVSVRLRIFSYSRLKYPTTSEEDQETEVEAE
jgi:hypothetical protein